MIKKAILIFLLISYSVFGMHAYMRTAAAAGDLSNAVMSSQFDAVGVADEFRDKTAHSEALSQMTPEEVAVMNNPEAFDTESVQYVAAKYTAVYAEMKGLETADIKLFDDALLVNEQGKNVKASDTTAFATDGAIYLEADKIQENGNLIHALGHENKRQDQIQSGVQNNTKDGVSTVADKEAYAAGVHATKAFELEKRIKKPQSYEKTTYVRSRADKDVIAQGSKQASKVENVQPWVETGWDALNVSMGVASGANNLREGKYGAAALDGLGLAWDGITTVIPGLPGGAGSAIKAWRAKKAAKKLLSTRQKVIKSNSIKGTKRERIVQAELEQEHGVGNVLQQRTILDKNGKKLVDPKTGQGRRLDHVVFDEQGNAIKRVETTSKTAPKYEQLEKEKRILRSDDAYVKNPENDKLIKINDSALEVRRLE